MKENKMNSEEVNLKAHVGTLMGRIRYWNEQKGYGFITDLDSTGDVFFHATNWMEDITPRFGMDVTFSLGMNRQGPCGENVKLSNKE